ncbi:MAG: chemotaxis protein CheW [Giesbergeria sp.]|uniref:chemotaxis protein CheW n=1 Tax=Giesbergeria sp. TaxID=2818473 RepID=UPI00262F6773|nr:chemotaxis protein CheW [Giesbergeria sp.]MDD2608520.1 chemotaxis protein CheW [Giesbergeria sp.]
MSSSATIHTDTFIPFMRDVARCENALRELNLMWRLIEASAKMNCPAEARSLLPMMSATREGFQRLESELVTSLVQESIQQVMAELGTSARQVIDMLVRNLYERTADVGFLATDEKLCRFVAGIDTDPEPVLERLREYRDKYTVYDEILLLDAQGTVLVHTDSDSPIEGSLDPLIAQTLQSRGYVETFRASNLRPGKPHALLYSQRILDPRTSEPVGVLCLSFDFASEMDGIFQDREQHDRRSLAVLLNGQQRVIASSDPLWLPVGAKVPVNHHGAPEPMVCAGRTYLVQTALAQAYQGYPGPKAWAGQVMVPIELAFATKQSQTIDRLEPAVALGLLAHAQTFCPPLNEIVLAAQTIRRVVWNGQVMTATERGSEQKLKAVLEQVGQTGARTNQVFQQSICDLYGTALGSRTRDSELLTHLLVSLLDRNLYERANDCRWWAQTPELAVLLAGMAHDDAPPPDPAALARITGVLERIHALYTVYEHLVVYDRHGRIVASSRPRLEDGRSVLELSIEADTLAAVLALPNTQSYHVSPWRASPLCRGQATYVYHAAIRASGRHPAVLGGIGIVFSAPRELQAMLEGSTLDKPGVQAAFINRQGQVLASTCPDYPSGSHLVLPPELLQLEAGHSLSRVMVLDGHYCIVGASASSGYREFKRSDGYRDDVLALSFERLGAVQSSAVDAVHRQRAALLTEVSATEGREMATFFVGPSLLALDAASVCEALPATAIAPVSASRQAYCVGTLALKTQGNISSYVWVFDLGQLLSGKASPQTPQSQVIVLRHGEQSVGLLASELHGVGLFAHQRIVKAPGLPGTAGKLITHLIKGHPGQTLIQCLDVGQLVAMLCRHPALSVEALAA